MEKKFNPTRREFLKKGAVAGVVATGGMALGFGTGQASASTLSAPEKWDAEYDVIVVGSGFAGLAAAITAREAGAGSVVVIEKMPVAGGNSIINGGLLAVVNSELQKKEGVKDSVDLYLNDLLKAGRGINHVRTDQDRRHPGAGPARVVRPKRGQVESQTRTPGWSFRRPNLPDHQFLRVGNRQNR